MNVIVKCSLVFVGMMVVGLVNDASAATLLIHGIKCLDIEEDLQQHDDVRIVVVVNGTRIWVTPNTHLGRDGIGSWEMVPGQFISVNRTINGIPLGANVIIEVWEEDNAYDIIPNGNELLGKIQVPVIINPMLKMGYCPGYFPSPGAKGRKIIGYKVLP